MIILVVNRFRMRKIKIKYAKKQFIHISSPDLITMGWLMLSAELSCHTINTFHERVLRIAYDYYQLDLWRFSYQRYNQLHCSFYVCMSLGNSIQEIESQIEKCYPRDLLKTLIFGGVFTVCNFVHGNHLLRYLDVLIPHFGPRGLH